MLCVRISNVLADIFGTPKGVRQDDPISPQLFNIISDSLARMFWKSKESVLNSGLVAQVISFGMVILKYVDDTIIMFKENVEMDIDVKLLIYLYESMSRLKINSD
jgi:hypothetical protein